MEALINLETAKLAKELGFNWKIRTTYNAMKGAYEEIEDNKFELYDFNLPPEDHNAEKLAMLWSFEVRYSAPTQSLLQKWLRDIHKLSVEVTWYGYNKAEGYWFCTFIRMNTNLNFFMESITNSTYESTLEEGLLQTLKYLKNER